MGKKRPKFHCKSEAQKKAIAASYARKAKQQQQKNSPMPVKQENFKIPLHNGGYRWNIYRVSDKILNGRQSGDVHGGLVIDESNNNVMLAEVTHSQKKGKRNNLPIRNLNSQDLDKDGTLRESYIERKLVVSIVDKAGEKGIDVKVLNKQMNDLQFTEAEKQKILEELSHLSTAEEKYKLFQKLAEKKNDTD